MVVLALLYAGLVCLSYFYPAYLFAIVLSSQDAILLTLKRLRTPRAFP